MKTRTIILFAACAVMMLSFGFASVKSSSKATAVSIEKNVPVANEAHIGLLSEDKF